MCKLGVAVGYVWVKLAGQPGRGPETEELDLFGFRVTRPEPVEDRPQWSQLEERQKAGLREQVREYRTPEVELARAGPECEIVRVTWNRMACFDGGVTVVRVQRVGGRVQAVLRRPAYCRAVSREEWSALRRALEIGDWTVPPSMPPPRYVSPYHDQSWSLEWWCGGQLQVCQSPTSRAVEEGPFLALCLDALRAAGLDPLVRPAFEEDWRG